MKLLAKEQQKSYQNAKNCYICEKKKKKNKKKLEDKHAKDKKHYKVRDDCHYTGE